MMRLYCFPRVPVKKLTSAALRARQNMIFIVKKEQDNPNQASLVSLQITYNKSHALSSSQIPVQEAIKTLKQPAWMDAYPVPSFLALSKYFDNDL